MTVLRTLAVASGAAITFVLTTIVGPLSGTGALAVERMGALAWIGPVFAATVVGAIIYAQAHGSRRDDSYLPLAGECDSCGGVVRADWRLCPHCGMSLPDSIRDAEL